VSPRDNLDAVANEKSPSPCQELNPGCPTHSLVTKLTKLYLLLLQTLWYFKYQFFATLVEGH